MLTHLMLSSRQIMEVSYCVTVFVFQAAEALTHINKHALRHVKK